MVLGHVVAEEVLLVGVFHKTKPVIEYLRRRVLIPLYPVEDTPVDVLAVLGLASHKLHL